VNPADSTIFESRRTDSDEPGGSTEGGGSGAG